MLSFGEKLKAQRLQCEVSLDEIANSTKISRRFLVAMEDGNIDILPGKTFVKGFVKSYCSFMGVDPAECLALYEQENSQNTSTQNPQKNAEKMLKEDEAGCIELQRALILFAILSIAGVAFIGAALPKKEGPKMEAPIHTSSSPVTANTDSPPLDKQLPFERLWAPPSSLEPTLAVLANSDTWVKIEQGGRIYLNRVLMAGEMKIYALREPVILSCDNAGALSLALDGEPLPTLGSDGEPVTSRVFTSKKDSFQTKQTPEPKSTSPPAEAISQTAGNHT